MFVRRPNGQILMVPCPQCIKEAEAARSGQAGRPWLEICPRCLHFLTPGKPCLVCRLRTVNRQLAGSADGHYVSVYAERKES